MVDLQETGRVSGQWCLGTRVSGGSHLRILVRAIQKAGLSYVALSGVGFVGLCYRGDVANRFHQLRQKPTSIWSTVYSCWMVCPVLFLGEGSNRDIGMFVHMQPTVQCTRQ